FLLSSYGDLPHLHSFPTRTLFRSILDTAKLDRGAIELETLDFSLRELLRQVCDALRLGAEQKGLVLEMGFTERVGDIYRGDPLRDRKSTRLNSSHVKISYAVFCLK